MALEGMLTLPSTTEELRVSPLPIENATGPGGKGRVLYCPSRYRIINKSTMLKNNRMQKVELWRDPLFIQCGNSRSLLA
jgi:hypothetical protein